MYKPFILQKSKPQLQGYLWMPEKLDYLVCLIHGIGEHAGRYDRIGEIFKSANIGMLAMDLRGHGYSSGERGHTAPRKEVFKDIDLLMEYALKNYSNVPIVVYGHSMGGNLVLDYRRRGKYSAKATGYLVTSPWLLLVREIPTYFYYVVKLMSRIMPRLRIKTHVATDGNKTIISQENNKEFMHGRISLKTAVDCFETGKSLMNGSLAATSPEALKPMLLMHGDEDKSCSHLGSSKIADQEKDLCQYIEWKGYYHELHNGNQEKDGREVIDTMVQWIQSLSSY